MKLNVSKFNRKLLTLFSILLKDIHCAFVTDQLILTSNTYIYR